MSYIMDLRKIDGIGHRPLQTVGVCVYIFDTDGKILLTKRKDDSSWCVPGGIVEIGEIPLEAAKREVLEETGLEVDNLSLFDVTGRRRRTPHVPQRRRNILCGRALHMQRF